MMDKSSLMIVRSNWVAYGRKQYYDDNVNIIHLIALLLKLLWDKVE